MFRVSANKNKAWCQERERLTTGSVGLQVSLDFDSDWDGLSIFAVFRAYDASEAVAVADDTISIPACVLQKQNVNLLLGLYGVSADGKVVIPTVYCDLGIIHEGADPASADNYAPPDMALLAQIQGLATAAQAAAEAAASGVYAGSVAFSVSNSGHLIMTSTAGGVSTDTDLGPVSAYAAALDAGYTGTYNEFKALLIANGETASDVAAALAAVEEVTETASTANTNASAAVSAANAATTAASAASDAASAAASAAATKQAQHKTATVTLASGQSSWSNLSVSGVTATNTVIALPAPDSSDAWWTAGVRCTAQGNGTLSFASTATTTAALTANIVIFD